jgi:hypothetical protein
MLRFERKYLVHYSQLDALRARLLPFVQPDPHTHLSPAGHPEYTVRSIYYDTPAREAVRDKVEGEEARRKLRIRGYDQPTAEAAVFFEIKRKIGEKIMKHRAAIPAGKLAEVLESGDFAAALLLPSDKNLSDASRFFFHLHRYHMAPVNRITYEREAYVGKFNPGLRVTFDKNIRSKLFPALTDLYGEEDATYPWKAHFILEMKYFEAPMPSWMRSIAEEFELEAEALSKYVEGYFCHPLHTQNAY